MAKKLLSIILLISLTFSSCAIKRVNYTYDFKTIQQGLDFTNKSEQWVLNTIGIPERKAGIQVNKILSKFNKWTNNNTVLSSKMIDKSGKNFRINFSEIIDKESLNVIGKVSEYKYLINVYLLKNDTSNPRITIVEMMFDIYDIDNKKLMVSEQVIASMDNENTSNIGDIEGFRFGVTPNIIKGLIGKGLKRLERNSTF